MKAFISILGDDHRLAEDYLFADTLSVDAINEAKRILSETELLDEGNHYCEVKYLNTWSLEYSGSALAESLKNFIQE